MRLFVLGAGYVGTALIQNWTNKADRFWASTTTPNKLTFLKERTEQAFLVTEAGAIDALINECDGMVVCVAPGFQKSYEETYLKTAQSLLKSVEKLKKEFYLLYTSSTSVYGDHQGEWVDETSPRRPQTENASILCQTEDLYLSCQNPFVKVCVVRLGGIFGPGRTLEDRARAFSGKQLAGSGDSPTNHSALSEITKGIEICFQKRLAGVYNLVNSDHRTRKQLYQELCDQLNIAPPTWDRTKKSDHNSNCKVSNQKAMSAGLI